MNRPLLWCALAFAAGIYVADGAPAAGVSYGVVACGVGIAVTGAGFLRPSLRHLPILLAFAGAGAFVHGFHYLDSPADPLARYALAEESPYLTLEGRVREADIILDDTEYATVIVDVTEARDDGERLPRTGRVQVRWSAPNGWNNAEEGEARPVLPGEKIRVEGNVNYRLGPVNHGVRDVEDHLRRQGVHSMVRVYGPDGVDVLEAPPTRPHRYWPARWRQLQAERLSGIVAEAAIPLVYTVWLGDRRRVDDEDYDTYLRAGTAHILAVSGIHMGIVFLTVSAVLGMLVRNRRVRAVLVIVAVFGFALTTGARVSAMRASLMVAAYMAYELFDREPDTPSALSLAGLILLVSNPDSLFQLGFQLSFMSVASILLFHKPIEYRLEGLRMPWAMRQTLAATLAVQILPLPLLLHTFHVLPGLGPLVNLAVVPLLTLVLWVSCFTAAAAFVWEGAALISGHALAPLVWLIDSAAGAVTSVPGSYWRVAAPPALSVASYFGGVAAAWYGVRVGMDPKRWGTALALGLVGALIFWRPWTPEPEIVVLDLGSGDAIFVRAPSGQTLLVDGGDAGRFVDMGERVVEPFLRSRQVSRLDYVAVTHAHSDHIGGLFHVLERFDVGRVVLSATPSGEDIEAAFIALCEAQGVPVQRAHRGMRVPLEGSPATVMHPPEDWPGSGSLNDDSLVLRLDWPGGAILLTGDVESSAEAAMADLALNAEGMQAPHHGSDTSSTAPFIDAVDPQAVFMSTPGPPILNDSVLRRYGARDIPIWRTDIHGGLRITVGDDGHSIASAREERGTLPSSARP